MRKVAVVKDSGVFMNVVTSLVILSDTFLHFE